MNILLLLIGASILFGLGAKFYAARIARHLGLDDQKPTPAVSLSDGRDYVPTKSHVLFAHHFATIAGAGPIIGPVMGIVYGFVPAVLWVVLGTVFIGAAHDFSTMFASVLEKGKSMAQIANATLGKTGFVLFITFTLIMIILVTSSFLSAAAKSLTSKWPLDKLMLDSGQHLLRTVTENGTTMGIIGGIASSSVIIITALAPLVGFLLYRKRLKIVYAYALASAICALSVLAGFRMPIPLDPRIWMVVLSVYVLFAAGLPVWLILQPRDFINVQILYGGMGLLFLAVVIGGLGGAQVQMPLFDVPTGTANLGIIWPMMFIVIACGAISGFHALAAGGTSSKQVRSEGDIRRVAYNAMVLEGVLATLVLLALAATLSHPDYLATVWPAVATGANPILAFALAVGGLVHSAFPFISVAVGAVFGILMVEGFIVTTLDAAVRLNRYLFEELWNVLFAGRTPALLRHYWFNSGLAVVLMFIMGYTNAFASLWKIFGTANQLLASLSLMTVTIWLALRGRKYMFALLPAVFMLATTTAALIYLLLTDYWPHHNLTLIVTDVMLLGLSLGVAVLVAKTFLRVLRHPQPQVAPVPASVKT